MSFNFMKSLRLKKNSIWSWNMPMAVNFLTILFVIPDFRKNKHANFIWSSFQVSSISIKVAYAIEIWSQKTCSLTTISLSKLSILDWVTCMNQPQHSRQHVDLLAMQPQRWLLVRDIMVWEQTSGAQVSFSTLWFVGTCLLKIQRHPIYTRKSWVLITPCQNSCLDSARTSSEKS